LSKAKAEIEALEKIAASASVAAHAPNGYFPRDKATGVVYLKANEFNMATAITFEVRELWRFDPALIQDKANRRHPRKIDPSPEELP
jgi:hypothetical protein